jgi:GNAT superfamily N-acetyltransferase
MLEIRPITDDDIDAVAGVHVRSWQSGYAGIVPADYLAGLDPVVFAERRRSWPPRSRTQTLVAEVDDTIVGFSMLGPYRITRADLDPQVGEVYAIYLDPERWGTGIGRQLMDATKAALTGFGFGSFRLWVLEANDRARRFYERAGMRPDGDRGLYTPGDTGVELPELRYAAAL